jgi:hypothetical protein
MEALLRGDPGGCGADRADVAGDLIPVLCVMHGGSRCAADESHVCTTARDHTMLIASGNPLSLLPTTLLALALPQFVIS